MQVQITAIENGFIVAYSKGNQNFAHYCETVEEIGEYLQTIL